MGGVTIKVGNGGLGRTAPSNDAICGFIANGIATGSITLGVVYKLNGIQDLIDLGIDADYDVTNSILVYEQVKEFFRLCPNGTLHFMLVARTVTYNDLVDPLVATSAIKIITEAEGAVKILGVCYNPTVAVTNSTLAVGAIAKAQALVTECRKRSMPISVILEGKGFVTTTVTTLRDKLAPGVSMMVGQNADVISLAYDETYAAVGTALGVTALVKVNESIGWVGPYNLVGDNLSKAMIGGLLVKDLSPALLKSISDAGYIYMMIYQDHFGLYMNASHTADEITSDFCTIENNRTIDKASRLIRKALLPYVNSPVLIDPATGNIASDTIATMEAAGNKAIQPMFQKQEISGPDPQGPTPPFRIDPAQNILADPELIGVLGIIPTGTASEIVVQIGFTNPNL